MAVGGSALTIGDKVRSSVGRTQGDAMEHARTGGRVGEVLLQEREGGGRRFDRMNATRGCDQWCAQFRVQAAMGAAIHDNVPRPKDPMEERLLAIFKVTVSQGAKDVIAFFVNHPSAMRYPA